MYEKVDSALSPVEREKNVEKFWRENDIFRKSMEVHKCDRSYVFYDGPPTANGKPHIGHVETRAFKDMIPRYHAMKGAFVPRKAGWDTHGLPVELEVEKKLGLDGKEQIEEYGLEPFIKQCKESVWKYKGMWEDFSQTVGFWADMDDPYVTYHNDFIESEWWALKTIWDKGLLYKGFKIVPYCPRCGTPLSSHEVAQGYKDVKERSAIARFKAKGEDAYFLAWTTTPWTLPSNVALCVNPVETYVKVKSGEYTYYMAEALVAAVLEEGWEILERYTGKELEYKEYEPLFDFVSPKEKCWYVTCDSYVTLTDGTGIVHIAPAFGEDDANVGRNYGLPLVQLVDTKGEMTEETPWAGTFCKDADKEILKDLKMRGLLFSAPPFEHSYPFCWRCDTPLIYYARNSWFIRMSDVRDKMIKYNDEVNWIPESVGKNRFGDWIANAQDWALSRNRYWGTPLNIWECSCGHRHSVGSIQELKKMSNNCPDDIELHKPYIDAVTLVCPECGGEMKRVPEVIDCWFDSGSMPFAQHHYPFENKELFESQFPADFISEAVDQTRGWFYSLLAISALVFDKAPYKNVLVLGLVQDEQGRKMSKHLGNTVDPFEALEAYGSDAIRWFFYTNSAPWLPKRFSGRAVTEGQRKYISTLWNTYAFFVLYANIDDFDAGKYKLEPEKLAVMDRWLLSKLNTVVKTVDENLAQFRIPEAAKALQDFVDEMSNWYVRRSRERFWQKELTQDKINAYMTLYTTLVTVAKLTAPMTPFVAEDIYRNLVCTNDKTAPESVHLCSYPVSDESLIDTELETKMDTVLQIVALGRAARNNAAVKNRQPLSEIFVQAEQNLDQLYSEIVTDELNVKRIEFVEDTSMFTSYSFKPQLKLLGAKYGRQLDEVRTALTKLDGGKAMAELKNTGLMTVTLSTGDVKLTEEEVLVDVSRKEGFAVAADRGITVVLNTALDEALIEEGFIREIISKLQTMRKDAGFEVMDRIKVYCTGNDRIKDIITGGKDEISENTLTEDFVFGSVGGYSVEWDINGEKVTFGVEKL